MEIMTTWNTDFEFDLQRFATVDLSTVTAVTDATTTTTSVRIRANGSLAEGAALSTDLGVITCTSHDSTGGLDWTQVTKIDLVTSVTAATLGNWAADIQVDGASTSTIYTIGTVTLTSGDFTINAGKLKAVGETLTVTAGTLESVASVAVTLGADGSVKYTTSDTAQNTAVVTLPGDGFSVAVANTIANGHVTVAGDGTVTSNTTGSVVKFASGVNKVTTNKSAGGDFAIDTLAGHADVTKGTVTIADATNLTDTNYVTGGKLKVIGNTNAKTTLTDAGVVTNGGGTGTVTAVGISTGVNGVAFLTTTTQGTVKDDGDVTALAAGSSITGKAGSAISTGTTTNAASYTINKVAWVASGTAGFTVDNDSDSVKAGDVLVGGASGMAMTDAKVNGTQVITAYSGGSVNDGVVLTGSGAVNTATISDLDAGESVTANGIVYTAIDANIVKEETTAGTNTKYYNVSTGVATATFTTDNSTGKPAPAAGGSVSEVSAGNINLASYTDGTKVAFTAYGLQLSDVSDSSAAVTVQYNTSSKKSTVTVSKVLDNITIVSTGIAADITDSVGGSANKVTAGGNDLYLSKAGTLSVDALGVVTAATQTVASNNAANLTTTVGNGSFELLNATGTNGVVFQKGTSINEAKVKLPAGTTVTITESANNSSDATDTKITHAGAITGLDGDFTVDKAVNATNLVTNGSGSATINGKTWTVAGDDNGVTFTVNTSATGQVGTITFLDKDATVSTTSKLSGDAITVMGTTFGSVTAKNGATFTSDGTNATATLFTAKDEITFTPASAKYTVLAVGSASDGIVIGNGTLGALNDGDKIKVEDNTGAGTAYTIYEVSGNVLEKSVYASATATKATSTTSYTLSDTNESFSVTGITATTGNSTTIGNADLGHSANVTFGNPTTNVSTAVTTLADGVYVNADGTITTSGDKAVAKVSVTDDLITYTSQSSKAQQVDVTGVNTSDWSVTTGSGKDEITFTSATNATIDSGAGDDSVVLGGAGDKIFTTSAGKNKVTVGGAGDITLTLGSGKDEVTVNPAAALTGDINITATAGDNSIDMSAATGDVTITGGSGNDTIKAKSADDVVSGGGGKDVFDITTTSVKVSDYTFGDDVIVTAVAPTVSMLTGEGKITTSGGSADISANAGDFYAADIKSSVAGAKATHYAWAKEGGSTIDVTSYDKDVVLKGDADGVNTLYTGSGNDVIHSYADNDSVYGGEGKDTITLQAKGTGRVVGIATNSSKDTVSGFTAGFSDSDSIFMVDGDVSGVKTTLESVSGGTGKFTFKDGAASLTMGSVAVSTVTGAAEILVNGFKLAALAAGATAKVDDANYADMYMGDKSAVDFSAVDGDLFVDLSNGLAGSSAGAKYVGVNAVTGGNGNSTLMGTGSADYIVATSGKTSLFGGAGSDTLVGNSNSADVFFFGDGTGRNTITNFTTQGNENADTLQVYSNITGAKLNGSNVEISTADGSKAILTSQNANSKINVASTGFTGVAKVGSASSANNFNYDNDVTYYGGGSASDKIAFSSGYAENAQVWLDGSQGKSYASIDVVDGTNASGSLIVAGDSASQSIIGGKGDTSLWGGAGSATDTLKSSSTGKTMFWWGAGDGNDVVVSASADDSVNLYNVKLSDIDGANSSITNSGVVLALNDGSKLTMQTNRNMNFTIEGQSWTADQSSKTWKQNS